MLKLLQHDKLVSTISSVQDLWLYMADSLKGAQLLEEILMSDAWIFIYRIIIAENVEYDALAVGLIASP